MRTFPATVMTLAFEANQRLTQPLLVSAMKIPPPPSLATDWGELSPVDRPGPTSFHKPMVPLPMTYVIQSQSRDGKGAGGKEQALNPPS